MNIIESIKGLFRKNKTTNIKALVDKVIPSKPKFPCIECIVLPAGCSELCDKVEMDEKKLLDIVMTNECCPDCGHEYLSEGPSGGMCTNVTCRKCGHRFNFGLPLMVERI